MRRTVKYYSIPILIGLTMISWGCADDTYPDPNTVVLLSPAQNEVMDNGCDPVVNEIEWMFTWKPVAGATSYQIYVIHEGALNPATNDQTSNSFWHDSEEGFILPENTTNWKWRVRAFKNGTWFDWSVERTFSVEPLNTDC